MYTFLYEALFTKYIVGLTEKENVEEKHKNTQSKNIFHSFIIFCLAYLNTMEIGIYC